MKPISRRHFLQLCTAAGTTLIIPATIFSDDSGKTLSERYLQTISAVTAAYRHEMEAHFSYVEFSRRAATEKFPNVGYLFTALSTSELVHSKLFKSTLSELGVDVKNEQDISPKVGNTGDNLVRAAEHELLLLEKFYPDAIEKIKSEEHATALTYCEYAWESHQQHREHIDKIKKWEFFSNLVAKFIEKEETQYFVCTGCGSTVNEIPQNDCPICEKTSHQYTLVDRDAYLK